MDKKSGKYIMRIKSTDENLDQPGKEKSPKYFLLKSSLISTGIFLNSTAQFDTCFL